MRLGVSSMNEFFKGTCDHSGKSRLSSDNIADAFLLEMRSTELSSTRRSRTPGLRPARTLPASQQKPRSKVKMKSSCLTANSATSGSVALSLIWRGKRKHCTVPSLLQELSSLLLPAFLSSNTLFIVKKSADRSKRLRHG